LGIGARKFSETYFCNFDFDFVLVINYLFSMLGIVIPGYFYLKLFGNKKIFLGALSSCITFIFFGWILAILLIVFDFYFVQYTYSALIIPLIFGVLGFNIFAFRIK